MWKAVVTGVVAFAGILLALRIWLGTGHSFDFEFKDNPFDIEAPECTHFDQTGSMRRSTKLEGSVFRLHDAKYLYEGEKFPCTFEDSQRNFHAHQRYAPVDLVSGHYFALDPGGATAEARFYKVDVDSRVLLEAEIVLDDVLDLRWEPNVREVLAEVVQDGGPRALTTWLRALVHDEAGGNLLTDEIGIWAQLQGYKGILFFGARAISEYRSYSTFVGGDFQAGIPVAGGFFQDLRDDPTATNLVALSGVELVRSIRRYRSDDGQWHVNDFFGADEEVVDAQLSFTSADRREWIGDIQRLAGYRVFSIASDGQVEESTDPAS